jgi:hypothetical protein
MGELRSEYRILVGKPDGWTPSGKFRRTWEGIIKMDLKETLAYIGKSL